MSHTFSRRKESFCLAHQFAPRFGRNSRHFSISFLTALLIYSIQASIASAAITFVGRTQQNKSSQTNTTITLNTPSGIVDGDLMLVFVVDYSSNPVTPTNWTTLPAATNWIPYNVSAYYKFWHAGDPTSYTFGIVNNPKAVMRVYRGVSSLDAVSPAPSMTGGYTNGTSFSLPALSPTAVPSELYVAFYADDYASYGINGPSDLTHTNADQSGWSTFEGDKLIANAGTTPPADTATIATASNWIGFDITLKPLTSSTKVIGFVGRSQQNKSNQVNTTVTLTTPSGIVDGDLMLVFVVDYSSNPVTPANWISLPVASNWVPYNIFAYYKFWHAGDPTSYTFGIFNNPKAVMRVYRGISSIDAVSPAPTIYGGYTHGTSLSLPALSSTALASEFYVAFYADDYSPAAILGPGDLTHTNADQSGWSTFDGDKLIAQAGTTPPAETATIATASNWIGFDITLKQTNPSPTPTPTPSPTPTSTASPTPTSTASPTPTTTPSPTPTPAPTPTPTPSGTPTSTPTPGGTFPQFSTSGQILTSYTAGSSLFPSTMYDNAGSVLEGRMEVADIKAANANAVEYGLLFDPGWPVAYCNSSNFALFGGANQTCNNWDSVLANSNFDINEAAAWFNSNHIPVLLNNYICTGCDLNTWAYPVVQDYAAGLSSVYTGSVYPGSIISHVPQGMIIGETGNDEVGGLSSVAPASADYKVFNGLGMTNSAGAGFKHPIFGQDPFIYTSANIDWLAPTVSDFNVMEATNDPNTAGIAGNTANAAGHIEAMLKSGLYVERMAAQANASRSANVPALLDIFATGPYYYKGNSGSNEYTPGVDYDVCGGYSTLPCSDGTPAMVIDQAFFAVAHGFQGIRVYDFDSADASLNRRNTANVCSTLPNANGCNLLQEGSAPISDYNGASPGGYLGLGQDRWAAIAAFNSMINGAQSSLGGGL